MPISSYQVEWLIHQRRRWQGLVNMVERALIASPEKIELSTEGRQQAAEQSAGNDAEPQDQSRWPVDQADHTVHPEPVEFELERRAGSFMQPPLWPAKPHRPIPRVDLWESAGSEDNDD